MPQQTTDWHYTIWNALFRLFTLGSNVSPLSHDNPSAPSSYAIFLLMLIQFLTLSVIYEQVKEIKDDPKNLASSPWPLLRLSSNVSSIGRTQRSWERWLEQEAAGIGSRQGCADESRPRRRDRRQRNCHSY